MGCFIDYAFRRQFPETYFAMFMSSTEYNTTEGMTDAFIADQWYGYQNELLACGQASGTGPGSPSLIADPYPTWLRPVNDIGPVINSQRVFLESVEFYVYDSTLTGASGQEADVIAAIYASKATDDAYQQSFYRNGMIPNWQPNFCRPSFWVNDVNVFPGMQSSFYGEKSNRGDLSIGIPLGKCFDINRDFQAPKSIRVYAQAAQIVDILAGKFYQRYPLLCIATFWLGRSAGAT